MDTASLLMTRHEHGPSSGTEERVLLVQRATWSRELGKLGSTDMQSYQMEVNSHYQSYN